VRIIGGDAVAKAIRTLGQEAAREIDEEAGRAAEDLRGTVRRKLSGDVLNVRTNELRNSITVNRTPDGREVGTNVVYATIHEYGGTIEPQNAQNLSIPIGDREGSPTKHTDLSFIMPGGTKLLVDESGKAQYVLVEEVEIPKRPYMAPSLDERRPIIIKRMKQLLQQLIDRAEARGAL
jgi:phage gpG-like protein